jgi:hypothetical protein
VQPDGFVDWQTQTRTGVAAAVSFDIRPPPGQQWLLENLSADHDSVAAEELRLTLNSFNPSLGATLATRIFTITSFRPGFIQQVLPTWHETIANGLPHIFLPYPIILSNDYWFEVVLETLANTKTFNIYYAYRRVL